MPEPTSPGCMPRKGVSKFMVPRMWCLKGGEEVAPGGGFRATSAARMPPIEWPRSTISVLEFSWGSSLRSVLDTDQER